MKVQNYKNHSRLLPGYHYVIGLLILALTGGAIRNLIIGNRDNIYDASLLLLISIIIICLYFYSRGFALRAQDRAIRAEENFRHFILTGKPLDPRLTMSQIIALRFASDTEFPSLAVEAVDKQLSNDSIKKQILNWRGDYYRV